ncbi:amidohydrolase family protein [Thermosipho sp. (in: thermotogales)]|uniref:amidohydrolase n=1 Tax=Thermosipho sp. (in: thermotogales) TaxID=1968895 RepID=UPI002580E03C|nr:amidohydrolase family protein [Thermosipho sp. (in: thermotogales)]MBZ4650775.1 putative amidohydrolase family [Thermosipho sp. (in: thermotogales)]
MIKIKNAFVWDNGRFLKNDLYVKNGIFVDDCKNCAQEIDLEGKYILPGFSDSHAHVLGVGLSKLMLNLNSNNFQDEVFSSSEEIILGRGWTEINDKYLFDSITKPVILIRVCGHVAYLNKYAQKILGFNDYFIYENDLEKIWRLLPEEYYIKAFKTGEYEFISKGITSVHSDDLHGISFETLLKLLNDSKLRIYEKLFTETPWNYEFNKEYGISKIFGIKLFADGSLGGETAFLSRPYKNSKNYGAYTLPENFKLILDFAEKNNVQVCVHAIGDEAISRLIELFGRYNNHRIIHAQLIKEKDFEKLKNFKFSVQPHFYFEDQKILENIDTSGLMLYPFKRMFDEGYLISFSSDGPVSPIDPKYIISSALKLGFSFEDSIKLYTEYSGNMINEKIGLLKPNYKADFIVFKDKNLEKLEMVFINGEKVYDALTLNP